MNVYQHVLYEKSWKCLFLEKLNFFQNLRHPPLPQKVVLGKKIDPQKLVSGKEIDPQNMVSGKETGPQYLVAEKKQDPSIG